MRRATAAHATRTKLGQVADLHAAAQHAVDAAAEGNDRPLLFSFLLARSNQATIKPVATT
jgi:hypothetical protein